MKPAPRGSARILGVVPAVVAIVLLTAAASAPAPAERAEDQDTVPTGEALEARTREVASQIRCVVCQGLSIQDSPSELAKEMKGVVREQLAAGRSADEVKDYFVDTYGEWVLLAPEPSGFNLAVYWLPWIGLVCGAGVVVAAVRRWTRASAGAAEGDEPAA